MRKSYLGRSGVQVSRACLGTMVFGQQVDEPTAHSLMDYAFERGVNVFDTAEMYPIPPKRETQGRTEAFIGNWFRTGGRRDKVILASKVLGRAPGRTWLRKGGEDPRLTRAQIDEAIEGCLRRLQTDRIDLYQLHWPDRPSKNWLLKPHPDLNDEYVPFERIIESLCHHIEKGNIRHWGLSNETPWGTMRFFAEADKHGWPRPVSIQNGYNLLKRDFDYDMAELSLRENFGLLAYSPLAQGYLTGKYQNGAEPEGARMTCFGRDEHYERPGNSKAIDAYVKIAREHGLEPAALALKFCDTRPFMNATIIGATHMDQLKSNLDAFDIEWNDDLEKAVHAVFMHRPTVTAPPLDVKE